MRGAVANRIAIILAGAASMFSCSSGKQDEVPLQEVVAELNKKCPTMIDSETRLDRITAEEGPVLSYYYSLMNVEASKVDTHRFRMAVSPELLATIRVSDEMKQLRDQEVTIRYCYVDRFHKPIMNLEFTPAHYNK
jgi:hypothetical protein